MAKTIIPGRDLITPEQAQRIEQITQQQQKAEAEYDAPPRIPLGTVSYGSVGTRFTTHALPMPYGRGQFVADVLQRGGWNVNWVMLETDRNVLIATMPGGVYLVFQEAGAPVEYAAPSGTGGVQVNTRPGTIQINDIADVRGQVIWGGDGYVETPRYDLEGGGGQTPEHR